MKSNIFSAPISQHTPGFTLLEAILTIAIMTVLAFAAIPFYESFVFKSDLDGAAQTIAYSARRAQLLSQAADGDSSWGVKITTSSITLFRGTSFAARAPAFDEAFDLPGSLSITGVTEWVFNKVSGLPAAAGTTTLTSIRNETKNVRINSKGMVEY